MTIVLAHCCLFRGLKGQEELEIIFSNRGQICRILVAQHLKYKIENHK